MSADLLSPPFLFRFSASCPPGDPIWKKGGVELPESHRLPCFGALQTPPRNKVFADVRAAWSPQGLTFSAEIAGKKQAPHLQPNHFAACDGVHLWIDTRNTHNIHRASRFCHRFAAVPFGMGKDKKQPAVRLLPINRAKEQPASVSEDAFSAVSEKRPDGYYLQFHLPAQSLTGFDPDEHPRLGFSYAVADRELGWQTFSVGREFPVTEDPSLWGELEMAPAA